MLSCEGPNRIRLSLRTLYWLLKQWGKKNHGFAVKPLRFLQGGTRSWRSISGRIGQKCISRRRLWRRIEEPTVAYWQTLQLALKKLAASHQALKPHSLSAEILLSDSTCHIDPLKPNRKYYVGFCPFWPAIRTLKPRYGQNATFHARSNNFDLWTEVAGVKIGWTVNVRCVLCNGWVHTRQKTSLLRPGPNPRGQV